MADYGASVAAAGGWQQAFAEGHRVLHFPVSERINNLMYDGLLPPACSSSSTPLASSSSSSLSSSSSAAAAAAFPLCGALSGYREGRGPPPVAELRHPLELQQQHLLRQREQQQLVRAGALYGLHAPLRLKLERELCAMTQRLPGLPSSLWGLQTLMNMDEEITAEDYMGRDKPEEEEGDVATTALGIHERCERRFGIL